MKPLALEVKELIDSAKFTIIDRTFANALPKDAQSDTNSTDVLITEVNDVPTDYGNNDFRSLSQLIEVQIFYDLNTTENAMKFEIKFMRFFKQNNWFVDQTKPHTTDPDTQQVTKVFYFSRKNRLKGDI